MTRAPSVSSILPSLNSTAEVAEVWEQLWKYTPSDDKDAWLVDREARSPRWSTIVRRLLAWFGGLSGLRTVELGSGRGDLSALLAQAGARVTLVDLSDRALEQAQKRFHRMGLAGEFTQADFLDPAALPHGSFDVALSSGVIEHFQDTQRTRAIGGHLDLLREGGAAVISVPNASCVPYRLWKLYLEARGCWPYGFERPYSRRELRRRAVEAGVEECEVVGVGFWQSVGDHWIRNVWKRRADWVERRSCLDATMGMSLVMFARKKPGETMERHDGDND